MKLAIIHNDAPFSLLLFRHHKTVGHPLGGRTRLNPTPGKGILQYLLGGSSCRVKMCQKLPVSTTWEK